MTVGVSVMVGDGVAVSLASKKVAVMIGVSLGVGVSVPRSGAR